MIRIIKLLPLLLLSACASAGKLTPTSISPVCEALVGPIVYNSTKRTSTRFAGPALVPDLKQRNQVGENLGCPQYTK
jgi:hypothetical protein